MPDFNQKIKNFNQLLLAIGGVLALLFFLGAGILIAIDEFGIGQGNDHVPDGIISTEETEELLKDSLRKQIISFNEIELIDSAQKQYILPVRQAAIIDGESIDDLLGLTNVYLGRGSRYKKYGYSNRVYNNLALYESMQNESQILFDKRISISHYEVIKEENKTYVLIIGTDKDSDGNKYLNEDDLQKIFIYTVADKQLWEVKSDEKFTTLNVSQDTRTKDVIGKFGLDRNNNGKFDLGMEPMVFYKINLQTHTLIDIVSKEQMEVLQKLLEGR